MDIPAIRVNNLTKVYKLYSSNNDRLKEALSLSRKKYYREFFALNNVSFVINKGETVGIIGKNGSGKSTLLKILTGVLSPTNGTVDINGKVAALLELGAGFNPEFTGMENIYLQGTLFGLDKNQMRAKLQDIIEFADIGDFINQPVKIYSSGMFVRLAFAIQACIEPEILIVDEALAVGDAKFSNKCIDYMKKLVEKGTTVLFVTHDVGLVRSFCSKAIWINKGEKMAEGDTGEVTSLYVEDLFQADEDKKDQDIESVELEIDNKDVDKLTNAKRWGSGEITYLDAYILDSKGRESDGLNSGDNIKIIAKFKINKAVKTDKLGVGFSLRNRNGLDIITYTSIENQVKFNSLEENQVVVMEYSLKNILAPGEYLLTLQIEEREGYGAPMYYDFVEDAKSFVVFSEKPIYSLVKPEVTTNILKGRE